MSAQLFAYLNEVDARFSKPDPQYKAELEKAYLKKVVEERLPWLEKQRLRFLSPDFDPGNDWWGSRVEK